MSNELLKKKCVPCEGGVPPLNHEEILKYMPQVEGWTLVEDEGPNVKKLGVGAKIWKEYKFSDFIGSVNFINKISEIAEEEGHHPDIHVFYNKVLLELTTHAVLGLSINDFIMAAKIDAVL